MDKWQENQKTIPPQEMQLELPSPLSNENTAAETEEMRRLLIGAVLTQVSCTVQFATLQTLAVRSNSATPKMVEVLSYALSEMVNLSTSMCDHLRALTSTLMRWRLITKNDREVLALVASCYETLGDIIKEFDL